jgi:hypothetical protein
MGVCATCDPGTGTPFFTLHDNHRLLLAFVFDVPYSNDATLLVYNSVHSTAAEGRRWGSRGLEALDIPDGAICGACDECLGIFGMPRSARELAYVTAA